MLWFSTILLAAAASTAPVAPVVVTNVVWDQRPMPDYPQAALSQGVQSGAVQLNCAVSSGTAFTSCAILSETPLGAGFGAAALVAARKARLAPETLAQTSAGAHVVFTVRFTLQ